MAAAKQKIWTAIKEYAIIAFGILCYTLGWTLFLIPQNLVGGGVTGISSIIQYATHGAIPVSYSYFAINVILLVISIFTLGPSFGVKTVFAVVFASLALRLEPVLIPQSFIQSLAIDNGKLISVIMGGMISGLGIGIAMSQGGSTGGTDIVALLLNKYRGYSPGKVILWIDVVIILSSLFVPSYTPDGALLGFSDKILVIVYGFMLVFVCSTVVDRYLSGAKQSVQLFIFSREFSRIAEEITHVFHRGVTVLDGKGWYTQETSHVLMVVIRRTDLAQLLRSIKEIDSAAFVSVSSVSGVYGKGFDPLRGHSGHGGGGKDGSKNSENLPDGQKK